jgi:hypothetical protein
VHGIISIGPWIIAMISWNDFHFYMGVFPWVYRIVSLGGIGYHFTQLKTLRILFLGEVAMVSE